MSNINYRPHMHFTAKYGWLNDPNGLIYHNGRWNMYFQHNPNELVWGPMHWGHAVSTDLIHWEELPIALYPYEDIWAFSGSMVYDANNTSGMAKLNENGELIPPLAAFFTSHRFTDHLESQSVAFSYDGGITLEVYEGNPVIDTEVRGDEFLHDIRDPKVFKNPDTGLWNMSLAASDRCNFYESKNLLDWEKTGTFAHNFKEINNIWACTDLIPMDTEDGRKWILLASMENEPDKPMARTMYFVGDFDGHVFTADEETEEPLWIDFGWDNYAGVSFNNTDKKLMVSWGTNPRYGYLEPTDKDGYKCIMTCVREISLKKIDGNYRLVLTPFAYDEMFEEHKSAEKLCAAGTKKTTDITECSVMKLSGTKGNIELSNDCGDVFKIIVTEDTVTVDRSAAGQNDFSEDFRTEEFSCRTVKRQASDIDMTILYDVSNVEVFADGGLEVCSANTFPKEVYNHISIDGDLTVETAAIPY